ERHLTAGNLQIVFPESVSSLACFKILRNNKKIKLSYQPLLVVQRPLKKKVRALPAMRKKEVIKS
ncbi:hypothetical protein, partial [Pedobacter rhizosphaerae]|uniref:hypothetical protein n=1 Tax=Pedobacter rhizosphaerae TaxID=390241 RepID=UPI001C31AAE3